MREQEQKSRTFEDLQVWQKAIALAQKIYQITRESEDLSGDRSLVDQLRRASVSISANVSEGFERQRHSKKEYLRFLSIAKGSAGEVRSLLSVVHAVGYVDCKTFWQLREDALSVSKMLGHHMKQVERHIVATEKNNALAIRQRQNRYRSYHQSQAKAS